VICFKHGLILLDSNDKPKSRPSTPPNQAIDGCQLPRRDYERTLRLVMKLLRRHSLLLVLLAMTSPMVAAEKPAPAFNIQLEGVKFDYPGFEHKQC
jgi:hypothetical protein